MTTADSDDDDDAMSKNRLVSPILFSLSLGVQLCRPTKSIYHAADDLEDNLGKKGKKRRILTLIRFSST